MTLVAVAAIIGVSVQGAGANTFPNVVQNFVPFSQFQNAKTDVGPNGNESLIWDNLTGGYQGSVLWILDPQGQFVAREIQ